MSYDLMVFEKTKAPRDKDEFMAWYEKIIQWDDDHSYSDISIASPALRGWYREMLQSYPAMNGPHAAGDDAYEDEELESKISDYTIARDAIYVAFAWSQAESAYNTVTGLAKKHGVGFFDVSGKDGDIIFPEDKLT